MSEKIWPIISNTEALAVSEAYAGFSGGPFMASEETVELSDAVIDADPNDDEVPVVVSKSQYYYKPLDYAGKTAVLIMNADEASATMKLDFSKVPGAKAGAKYTVRDIWNHKDLGSMTSWSGSIESHDCAFFTITPA